MPNKRSHKKKYKICKDDHGKNIYAGDTVEVFIPYETSKPHQSRVYWNPLDGAFVKSHPSHLILNTGSKYRRLRDYLDQSKDQGVPIYAHPDDEHPIEYRKGYCRKVKNFYE